MYLAHRKGALFCAADESDFGWLCVANRWVNYHLRVRIASQQSFAVFLFRARAILTFTKRGVFHLTATMKRMIRCEMMTMVREFATVKSYKKEGRCKEMSVWGLFDEQNSSHPPIVIVTLSKWLSHQLFTEGTRWRLRPGNFHKANNWHILEIMEQWNGTKRLAIVLESFSFSLFPRFFRFSLVLMMMIPLCEIIERLGREN